MSVGERRGKKKSRKNSERTGSLKRRAIEADLPSLVNRRTYEAGRGCEKGKEKLFGITDLDLDLNERKKERQGSYKEIMGKERERSGQMS